MQPGKNGGTEEQRKVRAGVVSRVGISLAFVGVAAACWLLPARAQQPSAPAAGHEAPAAGHAAPAANQPAGAHTEPGSSQPGATAPGAGGAVPSGGTHEAGQPAGGHAGEAAHPAAGGHAAGGEHGEKKEEGASIHLPIWITGLLKEIYYRGPATLTAAGVVGANPAELKGKQVDYEYEDHHAHKTYQVRAVIGEVGKQQDVSGAETAMASVDGRQVTLIKPAVTFTLQQMFPEHLVVSLLTALTIALVAILLAKDLKRIPTRKQAFAEIIYTALDGFVSQLIGPTYKKYLPLVGTAFIYVFIMNLAGLIPGWLSPTANLNVTAGMALVVVAYVQIEGIRANGLKGYFMHFVGEPLWLATLNFPLHIIGEVARLLSLSIRLFGNIFGEDVVIVILIMLGGLFLAPAPMYFFAVFTSFVQAMVFSILMCVYIALMTVHEDGHQHGHGHDEGHGHGQSETAPVPQPAA